MRTPNRYCLKCSKLETLVTGQDVWPAGWTCSACGHVVEQREGISIFAPDLADTISGFDPKVFANLARIKEKHFWFLARNTGRRARAGAFIARLSRQQHLPNR
jgi:hypothetical protein